MKALIRILKLIRTFFKYRKYIITEAKKKVDFRPVEEKPEPKEQSLLDKYKTKNPYRRHAK